MRKQQPVGRITKEIARRICALRKQHGLTSIEVADAFNFSQCHWSKIENGEYRFTIELIEQIANYYGVPIVSLLFDEKVLHTTGLGTRLGKQFLAAYDDKDFRAAVSAITKAYHKRHTDWSYEACRRLLSS